ncbi:MAG: hypothetical protein IBJ13_09035 [Sphingopyxis sp.]|nr:hypothetical protein [Sphingopyxis sp.]
MTLTEIPSVVVFGACLVAFAFWRVFRRDRRFKSGPHNNWKNQEFSAVDKGRTSAEGTLRTTESTAPVGYPGEG